MHELTKREEHILLTVHFLKENAYLITIHKQMNKISGKKFSVGTIYAPLNRLLINGFLESWLIKTSESNKPVRYYKVSPKGYSILEEQRKQIESIWGSYLNPNFEN